MVCIDYGAFFSILSNIRDFEPLLLLPPVPILALLVVTGDDTLSRGAGTPLPHPSAR